MAVEVTLPETVTVTLLLAVAELEGDAVKEIVGVELGDGNGVQSAM